MVFHAINAGRLSIGGAMLKKAFIPCTPLGSLLLLKDKVDDLKGKNAVVIGRSNIVGKPMSQLLIEESCTVTVVHSKTKNIEHVCAQADIIVAAIGRAEMIDANWLKEGAVVIDVGINRIPVTKEDGGEEYARTNLKNSAESELKILYLEEEEEEGGGEGEKIQS